MGNDIARYHPYLHSHHHYGGYGWVTAIIVIVALLGALGYRWYSRNRDKFR
ncbi:hypothetical protein [Stackebrandtia sp.]|uniref:hypothetical protein n=1 Tax=Stackebrandtia sp. TaxID=2023065 RepID=UPI002D77318C|nr:hypothetical protein [Stackebrandtia sp.]